MLRFPTSFLWKEGARFAVEVGLPRLALFLEEGKAGDARFVIRITV